MNQTPSQRTCRWGQRGGISFQEREGSSQDAVSRNGRATGSSSTRSRTLLASRRSSMLRRFDCGTIKPQMLRTPSTSMTWPSQTRLPWSLQVFLFLEPYLGLYLVRKCLDQGRTGQSLMALTSICQRAFQFRQLRGTWALWM